MTDERLKAYLEGAETAYSVADAEQEQMQTELTKLRTELASQAAKIEAVQALVAELDRKGVEYIDRADSLKDNFDIHYCRGVAYGYGKIHDLLLAALES